jgi:hypothetical protein
MSRELTLEVDDDDTGGNVRKDEIDGGHVNGRNWVDPLRVLFVAPHAIRVAKLDFS